jgi:predicted methyltransferase MtxX (methanogen marker protein 4)
MADPTLELHDQDGNLIVSNDNWRSDQEAEIIASTIPPTNDLESAIVATLNPGEYTAIVRGANNASGVALVEAYQLPND